MRPPASAEVDSDALLGEVLTAIVTPVRRGRRRRLRPVPRACAAPRRRTAPTASSSLRTTGESPTLTDEEKLELWAAAVDEVGGSATVIASTGTYSTAHSVHLTEQAHELGVDGFLVVTPYYNKPPLRGIVEHFKAIAAVSDRPIVVYNIPSRVVVNIEPETMVELAEIPTVKAVKQANATSTRRGGSSTRPTSSSTRATTTSSTRSSSSAAWAGSASIAHRRAPREGDGRRYREGDVEGARAIDEELGAARDELGVPINPIPVKAALNLLGHEVGGFRLPLVEATRTSAKVQKCLERAGLLAAA